MLTMKIIIKRLRFAGMVGILSYLSGGMVQAGIPVWTITPKTPTTQSVPSNSSTTIKYVVTNQSSKSHLLVMRPLNAIVQITSGTGVCGNPFLLQKKGSSCLLILQALGYELTESIDTGPVVCERGSPLECYRPAENNRLNLTLAPPIPLPSNCVNIGQNNIQCVTYYDSQISYAFTNMTYALCRSAQCHYQTGDSSVTCNCILAYANQGVYSASTSPVDYTNSAPVLNTITSTFSNVNANDELLTNCSPGPYANCYGAKCLVNGNSVSCTCPVETGAFKTTLPPLASCDLGQNTIWSGASVNSSSSNEETMTFMYDTFFNGEQPN
jgi:hypothetical protein